MGQRSTTGYSILPIQGYWDVWTWRISGGAFSTVSPPRSASPIHSPLFVVSSARDRCRRHGSASGASVTPLADRYRRARVPGRRRRAPQPAVGRPRVQHLRRRRGEHRLEARGGAAGLGRSRAAGQLRGRAAAGRRADHRAKLAPERRVLAPEPSNPDRDAAGSRLRARGATRCRRAAAALVKAASSTRGAGARLPYDGSPGSWWTAARRPAGNPQDATDTPPGARLPHAWMRDGASLYDQLGSGFTLLRLSDEGNAAPFVESRPRGAASQCSTCASPRSAAPMARRCCLVRPDQHVAWRGASIDRQGAEAIFDQSRGA